MITITSAKASWSTQSIRIPRSQHSSSRQAHVVGCYGSAVFYMRHIGTSCPARSPARCTCPTHGGNAWTFGASVPNLCTCNMLLLRKLPYVFPILSFRVALLGFSQLLHCHHSSSMLSITGGRPEWMYHTA